MRPATDGPRPTRTYQGRVLDVQPSNDPRTADHPVSAVLPAAMPPRVRKVWRRGPILDQGQEGACVGHGVTAALTGWPVPIRFTSGALPEHVPTNAQDFAFWCYHEAQQIDQWPGEDYSGTSVDAGMSVARQVGYIEGWRWITNRDEFVSSLLVIGPVVVAVPWYSGMYEAPGGTLVVSGEQVGWHCLLVNGYQPDAGDGERIRFQNSWGHGWGHSGQAWMSLHDAWRLLLGVDGAEACVTVGEKYLRA